MFLSLHSSQILSLTFRVPVNICPKFYMQSGNNVDPNQLVLKPAGHEIIKNFPCLTQLSTKFILLIKTKIPTKFMEKFFACCIYHANKC